jgi:hypothetical protein
MVQFSAAGTSMADLVFSQIDTHNKSVVLQKRQEGYLLHE